VVCSTSGISSGPVSFMEVFNAATETVKQGGTRRGANIGILRIDHPDIIEFILSKRESKRLSNFNISVGLTENFMNAVERDEEYPLINPRTGQTVKKVKARQVFNLIVKTAWESGEPGIIFLDRLNRDNPTPHIGYIESTNPCGEQPLLPYESCNLGSINLSRMCNGEGINYDLLGDVVRKGVRFLDNVIEMNHFPISKIREMSRGNRKIGLGVMGFADLLLQLSIPYDSKMALSVAKEVMGFISHEAKKASIELAKERGNFPNFKNSVYDKMGTEYMRNATVTTIAPTGTISIIAGTSSGIEPIFAVSYVRNVLDGEKLMEVNPHFERVARQKGFYSEELMHMIAQKDSIRDIPEIPDDVKRIFVTSHDISPEWHIRMQAVFQKYTDNAVSKTVNFPQEASPEDVAKVYWLAYHLDCKGVTVYRDGSRPQQVLKKREREKQARVPRQRPEVTRGSTIKIGTGCGNLYVTVNEDDQGACELFTQMGKSGGCASSQSEAISRLISLALRCGVAPQALIEQLKGIRCPEPVLGGGGAVLSCPDAISKALEKYLKMKSMPELFDTPSEGKPSWKEEAGICPQCPECGNMLEFREGCVLCPGCGYSKCW